MLSPLDRVASRPYWRIRLQRPVALLLAGLVGIGGLVAIPTAAVAGDRPTNDDFANAQVLTGEDATASGSNVGATMEADEPLHARSGGASVWFSWTAPESGLITADLDGSDFDTVLGVYTGTAVNVLTEIASVDDSGSSSQGRVEFPVAAGTTYSIAVDGFSDGVSAATGSIELSLSYATAATSSIAGEVVNRQQEPLSGVCADAYASKDESAGHAVSDAFGQYRISGLPAGTYRVAFSDCGSGAKAEFYEDALTYELATPVTVVSDFPTESINAQLSHADDPAAISGRVTDTAGNSLANICVNLEVVGTGTVWQARTDSDGQYRSEVDPGEFTAHFAPCSSSGYPIEEWYNGATLETADMFTVTAGQETTGIDASMVIGGQVKGTVKNDVGTALQYMCVDLLDQTGTRVTDPAVTGNAGTYRFRNVPTGTYVIGFRNCRDIGPYADEFFEDAATLAEATPVVVGAAETAVTDGVVERIAPDTVISTGPADGSTINTATPTFGFAGNPAEAAISFMCQIDAESAAPCTSPMALTSLTEGSHTFTVYAEGEADTDDPTPATRRFTVDTIAPDTVIDSGPAAGSRIATRSTSFTFHGTAGDTERVQCRIDGKPWADCTSPAKLVDLANGSHGVEFRAVDAAGNVDASPATRAFQVQASVFVPPKPQPRATTRLTLNAPSKVRQGTKAKVRIRLSGVTNGTVVIRDGRKIIRTIKVKGKATVKLRLKKLGKHRLSATYAGTTRAKPAKSSVRTVVVKRKR